MNATTLFIVGLFLLLACAVLVGEAVGRIGLLPLVGQLAVGIVFGPTLLGPALGLASLSAGFQDLQILATFFVLMTAGISVTRAQFRATGRAALLLGTTLFLVPFGVGILVVHLLYPSLPTLTALFVSLTISITALPVLAVMLREFGLLESRLGAYLLSGAFVNELAAVTTFAILLRFRSGGDGLWWDIGLSLLAVGIFLGSVFAVDLLLRGLRELHAWGRVADWFQRTMRSQQAGFAVLMVAALGAALYSQVLGLTYLVGAFCAGLLVTPESVGPNAYRSVRQGIDMITWGLFIPLFFALVGLQMNLRLLGASPTELAAFTGLVAFALAAKFYLGRIFTLGLGRPPRESTAAGFLLSSRGAVELAMAVTLLSLGVFTVRLFTIVAALGLVTTIISPMAARPFLRGERAAPTAPPADSSPR